MTGTKTVGAIMLTAIKATEVKYYLKNGSKCWIHYIAKYTTSKINDLKEA